MGQNWGLCHFRRARSSQHNMASAEAYFRTKWDLDPSNRLVTIQQCYRHERTDRQTYRQAEKTDCLSNALDRPTRPNQFFSSVSLFVCLCVCEQICSRSLTSTITDFHKILHAAQKCGRLVAYCLRDKPEVVCRYLRCADSDFDSLQALVTTFFNSSAPNPIYRYNSAMPTLYSVVNETGYRNRILEMCKFRFRFRLVHCGKITSVTC